MLNMLYLHFVLSFHMSLVEGIMCHSINYFIIVFNIFILQYVHYVSNVHFSCIYVPTV